MDAVSNLLNRKGRHVHVVGESEAVAACAQIMTERKVGSLLVVRGKDPVGIVTWHDVLETLGRQATGLDTMPVTEIMTKTLATTDEAADLDAVMKKMVDKQIRHMPVLRNEEVVGLVTLIDVLRHHLQHSNAWNDQLESYIYGTQLAVA